MSKTKDFYNVLFNKDEYTCFTDTVYGRRVSHARRTGTKEENQFFSINPLHKGSTRLQSNVSEYRNMLIEIDKDADGQLISREEQYNILTRLGVPYSTLVWSGGKSYHAIISVEGGFEDGAVYRQAVEGVYRLLQNNGCPNDEQVKDPARLSRAAGAVRTNTKQFQEVHTVRPRISRSTFEGWLKAFGEEVRPPVYRDTTISLTGSNDKATTEEKVKFVEDFIMSKQPPYESGNYNWEFTFACNCLRTGMTPDEVRSVILQKKNHLHENNSVEGASKKVQPGEEIYVYSEAEKKAWGEEQRRLEREQDSQRREEQRVNRLSTAHSLDKAIEEVIDNKVTGHDWIADIHNYIQVGDKYYAKQYLKPGNLIPIGLGVLKTRLGFSDFDIANVPYFQMFTVDPGHGNDFRQVIHHVHWNRYREVNWNPKNGTIEDFPYTWKMIQHLFGKNDVDEDQVEEILDWLTLLITKPKQQLHQILLYSKEQGTSKTAFAKLVSWLVQENYMKVSTTELEEKFNAGWADKLVIHIDEGKFQKPKEMAMRLRDWGTSETINLRMMGTDYTTIPFYGKFIITTNESDGLYVEEEDRRIWAREAQVIPINHKDPHYEVKMKEEIDYFVHYLLNRQMKYETSQGEFWLPREIVNTGGKLNVAFDNKTDLEQRVIEYFQVWFNGHPTKSECICQVGEVMEMLTQQSGYEEQKISAKAMGKCLRSQFNVQQPKNASTNISSLTNDEKHSKWYIVPRQNVPGLYQSTSRDIGESKGFGAGMDIFNLK